MKRFWVTVVFILIVPTVGQTGTVADYLIMQDIGPYKFMGKGGGQGSGIVSAAGHFNKDHIDESYGGMYFHDSNEIGVNVEVTRHMDSPDSLKWLLHEAESNFRRNPEQDRFKGVIREINGSRIFTYARGTHYNWISNSIIVDIRYTDLQKTKPEPAEVIAAYLQKHPSTMPPMIMDAAHDVQWIKDEMDRRLWLCDKWFLQITLRKADEKQVYQESVKSMNIFLDYREKYYRIKAADEKNLLAGYLSANNGTGIKAKLTEYKNWWTVNKGGSIALP